MKKIISTPLRPDNLESAERETLIDAIVDCSEAANRRDSGYPLMGIDEVRALSRLFSLQALRETAYDMVEKYNNREI